MPLKVLRQSDCGEFTSNSIGSNGIDSLAKIKRGAVANTELPFLPPPSVEELLPMRFRISGRLLLLLNPGFTANIPSKPVSNINMPFTSQESVLIVRLVPYTPAPLTNGREMLLGIRSGSPFSQNIIILVSGIIPTLENLSKRLCPITPSYPGDGSSSTNI